MLFRSHKTSGTGLFTGFYDWGKFPERLLRPPPGWPQAEPATALAGLPKKEAAMFEALYYSDGSSVTYYDLYQLLLVECKAIFVAGEVGAFADVPLLGEHGDAGADENPVLRDILRDIVAGWPPPTMRINGRDDGAAGQQWLFPNERDPGDVYRRALHALMTRCGIFSRAGRGALKLVREAVVSAGETFIPQVRDRRAPALRQTLGVNPLLYRSVNTMVRPRLKPSPVTHVYLDVSGSMTTALPFITHALKRPLREGVVKLFGFSTVVSEITGRQLAGKIIDNTCGTDINAVLRHLAEMPAATCPRRVLLLTDGYVGLPASCHLEQLRRVQFDTGLTGDQIFAGDIQKWTRITHLPSLESNL